MSPEACSLKRMIPSSPWPVYHFAEVTSTQDVAKDMTGTRQEGGCFVVLADHQTNGRGRMARKWESLGRNLQATLAVPIDFPMAVAPNFSFAVAVALSDTIAFFCDQAQIGRPKIEHKWPNDIWVNDRKIAGILIEIDNGHLLIGTGVNLAHAPEGAICLSEFCDPVAPDVFLASLAVHLDSCRRQLIEDGFAPIREKWLERARGIGQKIKVTLFLSEVYYGIFDGLDQNGALRVRVQNERGIPEIKTIMAGDVFFGHEF